MPMLPNFHKRPIAPATIAGTVRLTPAGRGAFLVTLGGVNLGRVRMVPSKDGRPAAWSHGASFAEFTTPEAAAGNLYAVRHRRDLGRVRSL